jgi:hypothetical protein
MAVPSEYKFEKIVSKADNLIIHQASHPIHGKVTIYMPDDTVPSEIAVTVKRRLYQNGIRMRNISQLQLPLATRALEVSQNPDEPYIVTEYKKYNLQDLINNRTILKPKRFFQILSQILQAVTTLIQEGWHTDHIQTSQIQLTDVNEGPVSFTAFEGASSQANSLQTMTDSIKKDQTETVTVDRKKQAELAEREEVITQETVATVGEQKTPKEQKIPEAKNAAAVPPEKELRSIQRNIYVLGEIAYHLLFGNEYHLSDNTAVANIRKLSSRWRTVVSKALSPSLEDRYETYEAMLSDINKALTRNKKIAIGLTPVFVLLVGAGVLLGYNQYHRHKIMTSEAGQAIENFLNIVNKTGSEFGPPLEPLPQPVEPNDDDILKPFEEITTLGEED